MRRFALVCSILAAAALSLPAFAVTLTIGNVIPSPSSSDGNVGPIRTSIDLVHPASHTGSVTSAQVFWSSTGCSNAFKVKFFRRVGETLTMTAERGPFTPTDSQTTVAITPAVSVKQGDLIAVTRLGVCGNAGASFGFPSEGYLQYASDVTGTVQISAADRWQGGVLAVSASGTVSEWMAKVIPVVGSGPGGLSSFFKTSMQFFNPQTSGLMTCKVVFHAAGAAGASTDTTRLVSLAPGEVYSTPDIVSAMGRTGLGSLDISVPAGQSVPIIVTRVYNDAGEAGSSGLTEDAIATGESIGSGNVVLARGVTGFLVAPREPSKTRFNIGVRTLYSGAVISVTVRSPAGLVLRTATKTYTANYFEQTDAASFLGIALAGDESIQISVSSGSAIVYGSTTDNVTNDPAIQFVIGIYAIA